MGDDVENLVLEHLKRIHDEQKQARERDEEIISRLGHMEVSIARFGRDQSTNYEEQITDRFSMDKLKQRVERIERRLDLV